MCDLHVGAEVDPPTAVARPAAPVGLLEVHEEALVQGAHVPQRLPGHQQARALDGSRHRHGTGPRVAVGPGGSGGLPPCGQGPARASGGATSGAPVGEAAPVVPAAGKSPQLAAGRPSASIRAGPTAAASGSAASRAESEASESGGQIVSGFKRRICSLRASRRPGCSRARSPGSRPSLGTGPAGGVRRASRQFRPANHHCPPRGPRPRGGRSPPARTRGRRPAGRGVFQLTMTMLRSTVMPGSIARSARRANSGLRGDRLAQGPDRSGFPACPPQDLLLLLGQAAQAFLGDLLEDLIDAAGGPRRPGCGRCPAGARPGRPARVRPSTTFIRTRVRQRWISCANAPGRRGTRLPLAVRPRLVAAAEKRRGHNRSCRRSGIRRAHRRPAATAGFCDGLAAVEHPEEDEAGDHAFESAPCGPRWPTRSRTAPWRREDEPRIRAGIGKI